MRLMKTIMLVWVCFAFSGTFSPGKASCEIVDRTVATVNGDIILYSEIKEQLRSMEQVVPELKTYTPEKLVEVEKELLKQLIRQRLAEQEAKRLKVVVSNLEVDQTIEGIRRENKLTQAQFEEALKRTGQRIEKFREDVRRELQRNRLLERVLKMKTVITDQQVDAYLKQKPGDSISVSNKVHIGLIYLPLDEKKSNVQEVEKKGRDLLDELKRGADFQKIAIQHSKGPAAAEGGDIGLLAPDELAPYLASGISGLKPGQVSNLIKGPKGYYIVKVLGLDAQTQSKSDSTVREKVRTELYNKELDRKFDEWVRSLEAKAFIQISL